ncbi:MAG: restriction endonuclease [Saprospiraceae bacterium]|nr:restriction endonuclease [Saprospiraceae bacterium]
MEKVHLIQIDDPTDFEFLCCEVARMEFGDFAAARYGRKGQEQDGIDIFAINRNGANEQVVVQCKHKENTIKPNYKNVADEMVVELQKTIDYYKNGFDEYIYACNLKNDKTMQDKAAELTQLSGKKVWVWSEEYLEQSVRRHPSLQAHYAHGNTDDAVLLLNPEFLNKVKNGKPAAFKFYTGLTDELCQWIGVEHGLAALDERRDKVMAKLEGLLDKKILGQRVVTVVEGQGGSGKTTLLRRIALERAKAGDACWWVRSMDTFMGSYTEAIGQNQHLRHLIFVDDWYTYMKGDPGKEFFNLADRRQSAKCLCPDWRPQLPVRRVRQVLLPRYPHCIGSRGEPGHP